MAHSCNMCRLHSAPPQYVDRSHPYGPITFMAIRFWGDCTGRCGSRVAPVATPKGLESELMGLPWGVSSCLGCVDCISSLPMCCTFTPYSNHTSGCERNVHSRTMGSMAGFPRLGECSSISITLLLLSQETVIRANTTPNTPPIKVMGSPSNVWGKAVTAKATMPPRH